MFQRIMSGLVRSGELRVLTLTTKKGVSNESFQKHFRSLRVYLLNRGVLTDYIRCPEFTKTGKRHEHILFRGTYLEQALISRIWGTLHGSPVVYVQRAYGKRGIANYLANYLIKSPAGRYAYSWGWVWQGFAHSWRVIKRIGREYQQPFWEIIKAWEWCVHENVRPERWPPWVYFNNIPTDA